MPITNLNVQCGSEKYNNFDHLQVSYARFIPHWLHKKNCTGLYTIITLTGSEKQGVQPDGYEV